MPRPVGDLVDVRATTELPWLPGTVRTVDSEGHGCYGVELDTPVSSDAWSGVTRRYGGSDLVGTATKLVYVHEHVEQLAPNELIRDQGG